MNESQSDAAERLNWLRLARSESVGSATFSYLIGRYGSASEALRALPSLARHGERGAPLKIPSTAEVQSELDAGAALGAQLLTSRDSLFPRLLSAVDPPPPILWVRGQAELLNRPCLAMVGARNASVSGQRLGRDLALAIGQSGWVIVSGLARGIDAAAHRGALPTGTIAVLAGGVDEIYPAEHADLFEQILNRGCVVSERPPGYIARAKDFPRRNRIISGLSRGVIVVEAELRSGSLITARLAGEQGREVFAVPGSPADPRARGANDLIRQGATLVEEADDVLRHFSDLPLMTTPPTPKSIVSGIRPGPRPDDYSADLGDRLEQLLSPAPTTLDQLARVTGAPLPTVMAALTELSLVGRAALLPGGLATRT